MKKLNQIISDDTLNIVTFAPQLNHIPRLEQMMLFIKQNQTIVQNRSGAYLTILFYNGIENEIYTTGPGEHEIELKGDMVQFSIEDQNGLVGTPNYIPSFDIQLRDILAISLNY